MLKCPVCEKEIENVFLLQKHFGFKNAIEPKHKEFKDKQIKIAEELFVLDRQGDTFDLLKRHPEINLISEKFLREIWKNKFGSEAIDKRRVEIGNKKRTETIYQPRKQEKEKNLDKKCSVCDYRYTGVKSYSHHVSMMKDETHVKYWNRQKEIAKILFNESQNTFKVLEAHSEFELSERVLIRFWYEIYGKEAVKSRQYKISSISRNGILPWNNNLTKETSSGLSKLSETQIQKYKDGFYDLMGEHVSKSLKLAYTEGRRKPNEFTKEQKNSIALKLREGHVSGRIKTPHGLGGYRKDIGMYIRSTWEYNFVLILKRLNIPFEYEPKTFPLYDAAGNLIDSYAPDFRVKNKWYEIKGVFKSDKDWSNVHPKFQDNITKINMFKQQYPNEKLKIIGKKEYIRIIKRFNLPYRYPNNFFH